MGGDSIGLFDRALPRHEEAAALMAAYVSLDQLPTGTRAVVRKLRGGHEFATRLAAMGLVVGSRLEVLQNPTRGPLLVRVHDTRIALGRGEAMKILAEEVNA